MNLYLVIIAIETFAHMGISYMPSLRLIDLCLSDYFQGSANEVFAIAVDNNTTKQDLKEALLYDYNSSCGDEIPDFELLVEDLIASCSNEPLFPHLESFDEQLESVYAYFEYVEGD